MLRNQFLLEDYKIIHAQRINTIRINWKCMIVYRDIIIMNKWNIPTYVKSSTHLFCQTFIYFYLSLSKIIYFILYISKLTIICLSGIQFDSYLFDIAIPTWHTLTYIVHIHRDTQLTNLILGEIFFIITSLH